jgi:hypothetical protein
MFDRIAREDGLGEQHLKETTKSALEGDFAGQAIFMGLRARKFGEQLHFDPVEGDAQVKEKACRHPTQSDEGADALPIEYLHLLRAQARFQKFATILHAPTLSVHAKDAHGTLRIGDRPIGSLAPTAHPGPAPAKD